MPNAQGGDSTATRQIDFAVRSWAGGIHGFDYLVSILSDYWPRIRLKSNDGN